jgi:putative membrane protein
MTPFTLQGIYCGAAPAPAEIWLRWNFDPAVLAVLAAGAFLVGGRRSGLVAVGVLALVFVSPLCALSSALFSARVVHHVLLVAVAAPLLALALPARLPQSVGLPFLLATGALLIWHMPDLYDAALGHKGLYWAMQACLLGGAFLFWRATFSQPEGAGASWALLALLPMGLLGALLTFAPEPLYASHALGPLLWGTTPLADQQLGGLLMWIPAALPYAVFGALLARRAWDAAEQSS